MFGPVAAISDSPFSARSCSLASYANRDPDGDFSSEVLGHGTEYVFYVEDINGDINRNEYTHVDHTNKSASLRSQPLRTQYSEDSAQSSIDHKTTVVLQLAPLNF